MFRIERAQAFLLVRWHRTTLPFRATSRLRPVGHCAAGPIFEQTIAARGMPVSPNPCGGSCCSWIEPTRNGETEIVLITNLPAEVPAKVCCGTYGGRWRIESHYQELTDLLHCEVPTLGYPRAALFAFCMSVVAGNACGVLKGNLRVAHGEEMAAEISDFALVDEVAEVYPGMMVAVPPARVWPELAACDAAEVAGVLNDLARSTSAGAPDVPVPAWPEEAASEAESWQPRPSRLQQETARPNPWGSHSHVSEPEDPAGQGTEPKKPSCSQW